MQAERSWQRPGCWEIRYLSSAKLLQFWAFQGLTYLCVPWLGEKRARGKHLCAGRGMEHIAPVLDALS